MAGIETDAALAVLAAIIDDLTTVVSREHAAMFGVAKPQDSADELGNFAYETWQKIGGVTERLAELRKTLGHG